MLCIDVMLIYEDKEIRSSIVVSGSKTVAPDCHTVSLPYCSCRDQIWTGTVLICLIEKIGRFKEPPFRPRVVIELIGQTDDG